MLGAAHQVGVDFQITAAGGVQDYRFLAPFTAEFANVGQGGALGFFGVLQQASGSADGQREVFAAKAGQITDLQLLGNHAAGGVGLKQPWALAADTGIAVQYVLIREVLTDQDLRWAQALELPLQALEIVQFRHGKPSAGDVERGKTKLLPVAVDGDQEVIPAVLQERIVAQRARRHNANHLALYRPLAGRRVANLFANGDGLTGTNQTCNVAFSGMVRNARHGNRAASGLPTGRQGDIHQLGGFLGILVEQLVKVPHAVEHQFIGVFALDLEVLPHHWGVVGQIGLGC